MNTLINTVCEKSSRSNAIYSHALRDEKNCKFVSFGGLEVN